MPEKINQYPKPALAEGEEASLGDVAELSRHVDASATFAGQSGNSLNKPRRTPAPKQALQTAFVDHVPAMKAAHGNSPKGKKGGNTVEDVRLDIATGKRKVNPAPTAGSK